MAGNIVSIQNSLNAGELSPSVYGRIDLEKYHSGTSTCRNFFVNYQGGIMSRAGFAYVGTCLQPYVEGQNPPRDIPFQFNIGQGYVLEFGQYIPTGETDPTGYMRVKYRGAYVTETVSETINPNYLAIEAFVGADTPVGYNTFGGLLLQDRSISYLAQLEDSPTTGSAGFKLFALDTTGDELVQATTISLGTSGISAATGACLHPNGNIYCQEGTSNSNVVDVIRASDLTLLGTFGVASSHLGSDSTHFALSPQIIPVLAGSSNRLVSVGISAAAAQNEVSLWSCTSTSLSYISKTTTTEHYATICEGARGDGTFFALGSINYLSGLTTPFSVYSGSTSSSAISLNLIGQISPTDVDPTWTNFITVSGPGYDANDGNLLFLVTSPDAVTNKYYLIKVDASSGDILWTSATTLQISLNATLERSYMDGLLQVHDSLTNNVVTFSLADGTQTATAWNSGIVGGNQFFDHSLGMIFLLSGYSVSSGPVPTYLGSYLVSSGNIIPSNRYMAMYTSQTLPIVNTAESTGFSITNISTDNPAEVTINFLDQSPYFVGDWVYFYGVEGMTNWNGLTWIVNTNPSPGVYTFTDLFGNVIDSTSWSSYTSGGICEKLFTLTTPYLSEDIPFLKYTQSADVMTLTCVNPDTGTEYPPYSLIRHSIDDWTLEEDTFGSNILPPSDISINALSSSTPTTWYAYTVTSVDASTGEESIASDIISVQNNDISIYQGSNTLNWSAVDGAGSYNIYASPPSYSEVVPVSNIFGFIGSSIGPGFTDTNTTPDYTVVPPVHTNPFARGAIIDVIPTNVGINYSQQTVDWSLVNSSSGSGFDGYPVVVDGGVVGFIITDQGSGYDGTQTIEFTDTGGGVAVGNYAVVSNPSDGDTLTLNSAIITFRNSHNLTHPEFEVSIGTTIPFTLGALTVFCNSYVTSSNLNLANYTHDDSNFYITFKTPGTDGNGYSLGTAPSGWTRSGTTLSNGGTIGSGAVSTLLFGESTGTYPSVAAYFQQRRVYAGSTNEPDTYWMSQPGLYSNMDTSIPVTAADAITGTPWAQQVNGIQFMEPMPGGLVVFTGKGAWQVNGGSSAAITPSNQTATAQAFNGCSNICPPLPINYNLLYIQAKGSIPRDLSYNFYTNIYTGVDLSILANHLFQFNTISQWAWCEEPYKLVWALRNDGTLLSLTYMKEQDVIAWTRHDTNGLFASVCSITEPPIDALYVIVQRYIQGAWRYYSERMNNRIWNNVEESFCVDSGVSYPVPLQTNNLAYLLTYPTQNLNSSNPTIYPDATLSMAASSGSDINFQISSGDFIFTSDNIGNIIRAGGGSAEIITINSDYSIQVDVLNDITQVIPNDPNNQPIPVASGDWSLAVPVTIVSNLNHLEGMTVTALADGGVIENQVVTDGQIILDQPASLVTIGLPYTCQAQTLFLEHPDKKGTAQNRRKTISSVGVRVQSTRGLQLGADQPDAATQQNFATVPWTNMNEIKERTNLVDAGTSIPLFTGDYFKNINTSWAVTGQVAVQQVYPLPANILAIISYWTLGDN